MIKQEVVCIKERTLNEFKEGEHYILDLGSVFSDCDGDWYGTIYEMDGSAKIGSFKLNRFVSVQGVH